jgi:hypothetical protein
MHSLKIKILNFEYWCLLHVPKSRVRLQEDACICSYGVLGPICIGISSLHFYLLECLCLYKKNVTYHNCIYNRLPENVVSGSKYLEDIKIKNKNIIFVNVHFVCCIVILQCTVQIIFKKRSNFVSKNTTRLK